MPLTFRKAPPILDEAIYPATLLHVKEVQGTYGPQLVWQVKIVQGLYEYLAQAYTKTTGYEHSQEREWTSAVLGETITDGNEVDDAELQNKPIRAKISYKLGSTPGQVFYRVEAILSADVSPQAEDGMAGTPINGNEDVPF